MSSGKRRVLIAMDGSVHSSQTFEWYLDNMRHDEDELLLAWNVDAHPATFGTVNLMTGDPDVITKAMTEQKVHTQNTMKQLEQKLADWRLDGRVLQLHGHKPGESLIQAASKECADLIICGSRGLGSLRRTLLGSISREISQSAQFYVQHPFVLLILACRNCEGQVTSVKKTLEDVIPKLATFLKKS